MTVKFRWTLVIALIASMAATRKKSGRGGRSSSTDSIWQDCTVSEKGDGMLRVMCEEYVEPAPGTYTRAGGRYIVYGASDLRRPGSVPAPPEAGGPSAPSGSAGEKPAVGTPAGSPPPPVVSKSTGPRPTGAPKATPGAAPKGAGGGLTVGEYACYGSGGQILAGFGFKALGNGRYTDLEGGNPGSYSVNGDTVTFRGGHLDGTVGRALDSGNFRIGAQATCEPF